MIADAFDTELKLAIYRYVADTARVPTAVDLAPIVRATPAEVRTGFDRMRARRMLVLMDDGETIRMAPPFSGVPTQHAVRTGGKEYFANCAWDSLGILAALHADGAVRSRCEQTLEPIHLTVSRTGPAPEPCVIHFAVPAAQWWADIVFT
jgi:Alkylmercury lyase